MPFRTRGLPRRLSHLMLPVTAAIVLLGVLTWVLWALSITPADKLTPGVILLILGFSGTPVIVLLVGSVGIAILEGALVDTKNELLEEIDKAALQEHDHPDGHA